MDAYLAVIQTLAVVTAVGASVVALRIASMDRKAADDRAERERLLDQLVRLGANLYNPGSTDEAEQRRLGTERETLIRVLGPDVVPLAWELFAEQERADAEEHMANDSNDKWHRAGHEVFLVLERMRPDAPG